MTVGLIRMLANTEDMIMERAEGVKVKVSLHETVGAAVGHYEVSAVLDNPGMTCPDEIVLKYSGDLSLGQLAMSASDFLEDVVISQVYQMEDGMVEDDD